MKATVVYYSHKGKTAGYAREIAMYLWSKGWNVSLSSLSDFKPERIRDTVVEPALVFQFEEDRHLVLGVHNVELIV